MGFEEGFKDALKAYLNRYGDIAREVVSYEQDVEIGGYCETCYYEEIVVKIQYTTLHGTQEKYTYYGSMSGLICELADMG